MSAITLKMAQLQIEQSLAELEKQQKEAEVLLQNLSKVVKSSEWGRDPWVHLFKLPKKGAIWIL